MLRIILKENVFLFGDDFYIQKWGTVMGSNVPPFANTFTMMFSELYEYTHDLFEQHAFIWLQFIEDILVDPTSTIIDYVELFNNVCPELEFASHSSKEKVSFLDTVVKIDN